MTRIYLSPPHMTGTELELVKEAFDSNWIAPFGPHVTAFENERPAPSGSPCTCSPCSRGTGASAAR